MQLHMLQAKDAATMLLPCMVSFLERALLSASRRGYSKAELLMIDRQVVEAIMERTSVVRVDGNLAIEYVCDTRTALFFPSNPVLPLSKTALHDDGPASEGRASSTAASSTSFAGSDRQLDALKRANSKLMSERDRALHELGAKRARYTRLSGTAKSTSPPASRGPPQGRTVYGGQTGIAGGGKPSAEHICRSYIIRQADVARRAPAMAAASSHDVGRGHTASASNGREPAAASSSTRIRMCSTKKRASRAEPEGGRTPTVAAPDASANMRGASTKPA